MALTIYTRLCVLHTQQEQVRLSKAAINLAFAEEQENLAEERRTIKVSNIIQQQQDHPLRSLPPPLGVRLPLSVSFLVLRCLQAEEGKVRAAQKELHRLQTKQRAEDVGKRYIEQSRIRLIRQGITPPPHGLEARNGFATVQSHEAASACGPGPGAYRTEMHKSIGGAARNNEGATAPAFSILARHD